MNICVSANSGYMRYLYVMLTSLYINNNGSDIHVYVLQADFTDDDKHSLRELTSHYRQKIDFVQIDAELFSSLPDGHLRKETYFRFLMPYALPIDKVLYLDVDIIVLKSLIELYETDLNDKYLAACPDLVLSPLDLRTQKLFKRYDDLRYFNAGVILWDLKKIREHYRFDDFLAAAKELGYQLTQMDQTILNYMFYDKVKYIDGSKFNRMPFNQYHPEGVKSLVNEEQTIAILHLSGLAPWKVGEKSAPYKLWWDYARHTPYYTELLSEQTERVEKAYNEAAIPDLWHRATLWRVAFALKGTTTVERYMRESKKLYYLYGAGKIADIFVKDILEKTSLAGIIEAVIDKKKEGTFAGVPIKRDLDFLQNTNIDCCIIVSPLYDPDHRLHDYTNRLVFEIARNLPNNIHVLRLADFLYECYKSQERS